MRRASVRRSAVVGEDQVLCRRRLAVGGQRQHALLDPDVLRGLALGELADVLLPRADDVVLDEAVGVRGVLVETPALGAGAAAGAPSRFISVRDLEGFGGGPGG